MKRQDEGGPAMTFLALSGIVAWLVLVYAIATGWTP